MKNNELFNSLEIWFEWAERDNPNFWNEDQIACLIKTYLRKWGHWKCKPRGKPNKAFEKKNDLAAKLIDKVNLSAQTHKDISPLNLQKKEFKPTDPDFENSDIAFLCKDAQNLPIDKVN